MTKKCKCGKHPYFGFPGDKRATCCSNCKEDGMVDIKNKKCPCGKIPYFGFSQDNKASCCISCKKDGMVDIKNKKCPCGKRVSFGFPQDNKVTCCANCKKDGMIDIKRKKCYCGSGKRIIFGFLTDKKRICCSSCKKDGMVNIDNINVKKCYCGSGKIPIFGNPEDKSPSCCIKCKKDRMINIRDKRCLANGHGFMCPRWANPYYDRFCTHCFAKLFPNHPKTANICKHAKELKVVNYISSKYEGFLHDKIIGPSRRRIDLRKRIKDTLLCIEIDEFQHRRSGYSEENDEVRYNDLSMDFSGKYIFIRYNPDKFKDERGKKRNPKFETRMDVLEKEMKKQMLRIEQEENKELLEIHHLFFDMMHS
uniref:Endonuclease n=1 Tax=Iridovirus LCIVAC01 TaxID=2506607 RepID=A0A481YS81_9VIRU|nr:MAG: endonuclease [Iridovirus LCIVAC01]